jgi:hypothetical protein
MVTSVAARQGLAVWLGGQIVVSPFGQITSNSSIASLLPPPDASRVQMVASVAAGWSLALWPGDHIGVSMLGLVTKTL